MSNSSRADVLEVLRRSGEDGRSDSELLGLFRDAGDHEAFEVIVRRHGPMVFDVCSSVLANVGDAEDAFQACFLVLAQKAMAIRKADSLACWLHGVAFRVSAKARDKFARRRRLEREAASEEATTPADELTWREVRRVVHEELNGLPTRYREVLALCYLEGARQARAADELGIPKGTLKGRLEKGRALLRDRLIRRGLGPSGIVVAMAWPGSSTSASAGCVASVMSVVAHLAAGSPLAEVASPTIAELVREGAKTMWLGKTVLGVTVVGLVAALTFAYSSSTDQRGERPPSHRRADEKDRPRGANEPKDLQWQKSSVVLPVQPGPIGAVVFSPDGKTVAVASSKHKGLLEGVGEVRLYDTKTSEQRAMISGHPPIAFAPDSKSIVVSEGGSVHQWNIKRTVRVRTYGGLSDKVLSTAFSADGNVLTAGSGNVTKGDDPGMVRVWLTPNGQNIGTHVHPGAVHWVGFADKGTSVVSASAGKHTVVKTWDVKAARVKATIEDPKRRFMAFAVSPDGTTVASSHGLWGNTSETSVRVWNRATGKLLFAPLKHAQTVQALAFSPDGKTLASGYGKTLAVDKWTGVVQFWDATTGKPIATLQGHEHEVRCLAFGPDGKTLVTGSWDRTVRLWELGRPEPKKPRSRVRAFLDHLESHGYKLVPAERQHQWKVVEPKDSPIPIVEIHGFPPTTDKAWMTNWQRHTSLVAELNTSARLGISNSSSKIPALEGKPSLFELFGKYKSPADVVEFDRRANTDLRTLLAFMKARGVELRPVENESNYMQLMFTVGPDHEKKNRLALNYLPPLSTEEARKTYQLLYAIPSVHHLSWALFQVGGPRGNATKEYLPVWKKAREAFEAYPGPPADLP